MTDTSAAPAVSVGAGVTRFTLGQSVFVQPRCREGVVIEARAGKSEPALYLVRFVLGEQTGWFEETSLQGVV